MEARPHCGSEQSLEKRPRNWRQRLTRQKLKRLDNYRTRAVVQHGEELQPGVSVGKITPTTLGTSFILQSGCPGFQ